MPHAIKGAWIRPHAAPPPPPKPVDPIASNLGLLQYFAGTTRPRSTSPTKPSPKRAGAVAGTNPPPPKVKLPKGLGLEGLEGLQYRPPPPPQPPVPESRAREVVEVEVVDEGPEYYDEEGEEGGGSEDVVVVREMVSRTKPRRSERASSTRYHLPNEDDDGDHSDGISMQQRSYYRAPSRPAQPKPKRTRTPTTTTIVARAEPVRRTAGPIPHVSATRHVTPDPVGVGISAREALERGIRERKLERFGREERGWREERDAGRGAGREVARIGSGSRAMREAITPLVM